VVTDSLYLDEIPDPDSHSSEKLYPIRIRNKVVWIFNTDITPCSVNKTSVFREALEELFRVRSGHYRQDEQESKLHLQENGQTKRIYSKLILLFALRNRPFSAQLLMLVKSKYLGVKEGRWHLAIRLSVLRASARK
jgi:hypothetical protein